MTKKLAIINEIKAFIKEFPEMTTSEVIYSIYRSQNSGKSVFKLSDILQFSDEDVITKIERAREIEKTA